MKIRNVMFFICVLLSFLVLGCGGKSDNKAQVTKTNTELANEIKDRAKKQGLNIYEGLTVYSPDKSISVTFPNHYVILTKKDDQISQFVGIHVKHNKGINVMFAHLNGDVILYNSNDNLVNKHIEDLYKKHPEYKGNVTMKKINNKWFLSDTYENGDIGLHVTSSKKTNASLRGPKLLEDDLKKIAEDLKVQ